MCNKTSVEVGKELKLGARLFKDSANKQFIFYQSFYFTNTNQKEPFYIPFVYEGYPIILRNLPIF